ncbi:hypothetical protein Hdeb2414_s0043g00741761 [Helianthus debilis subsp. tardiflorus]
MTLDKSQNKITNKVDPVFINGAIAFAERGKTYVDSEGRIHCPCKKCVNEEDMFLQLLLIISSIMVLNHHTMYGFITVNICRVMKHTKQIVTMKKVKLNHMTVSMSYLMTLFLRAAKLKLKTSWKVPVYIITQRWRSYLSTWRSLYTRGVMSFLY